MGKPFKKEQDASPNFEVKFHFEWSILSGLLISFVRGGIDQKSKYNALHG